MKKIICYNICNFEKTRRPDRRKGECPVNMPDSNITKRALAQSLKELMAKRPFSKIGVADICESCGMSRKSFYYHFKDKYDLVHWIFDVEFLQSIRGREQESSWELFQALCAYFYKERDFYRCAIRIEGQNSFREYFQEVTAPVIETLAADLFADMADREFCVTFFADAILSATLRWLSKPLPEPPEEYLDRLHRLLVRGARHVLEDLEGPAGEQGTRQSHADKPYIRPGGERRPS